MIVSKEDIFLVNVHGSKFEKNIDFVKETLVRVLATSTKIKPDALNLL